MADEQSSIKHIEDLHLAFNPSDCFEAIVDHMKLSIPPLSHGMFHPDEVRKIAQESLIRVFKTIVDSMGDPQVQNHLECLLIAKTDLSKMINKNILHGETSKDIH